MCSPLGLMVLFDEQMSIDEDSEGRTGHGSTAIDWCEERYDA